MKMSIRNTARVGLLCSLGLILSYIEFMIPLLTAAPGVKIGLSNLVVLYALYALSAPTALLVILVRVLLSAFLFQGAFSIVYGLTGGLLSLGLMLLMKKSGDISIPVVSMAGGAAHNLGQFAVAGLSLGFRSVYAYLPVLLMSGAAAGMAVGFVCSGILNNLSIRRKK